MRFCFSADRSTWVWNGSGDAEPRPLRRDTPAGVEASYGIRDGLDLTVGTVYVDLIDRAAGAGPDSGSGMGDSYVLPKIVVWVRPGLHLAFLPGIGIPTGSVDSRDGLGTGNGYWSFMPCVALTRTWEKWSSNAAVVGTLPFAGKERESGGSFETDLALGWEAREWFEPEVELNYLHDFSGGGSDNLAITAGFVLPLGNHFRAEVGGPQAVLGRNTDQTTSWLVVLTPIFGKTTE